MATYIYNPGTWEVKTGESGVQGHSQPGLHETREQERERERKRERNRVFS